MSSAVSYESGVFRQLLIQGSFVGSRHNLVVERQNKVGWTLGRVETKRRQPPHSFLLGVRRANLSTGKTAVIPVVSPRHLSRLYTPLHYFPATSATRLQTAYMNYQRVLELSDPLDYISSYNGIPTIDKQTQVVGREVLLCAAQIFYTYAQHTDFAIFLVHRHHDLVKGQAFVRSIPEPNVITASAEDVGGTKIYGSSFCFTPGGWLPVEYQRHETTNPNPQFLEDYARFLVEHKLIDVLGLAHLSPDSKTWVEYEFADKTESWAGSIGEKDMVDTVTTEWRISCDGGVHNVTAHKECYKPEAGGHAQPPPDPGRSPHAN